MAEFNIHDFTAVVIELIFVEIYYMLFINKLSSQNSIWILRSGSVVIAGAMYVRTKGHIFGNSSFKKKKKKDEYCTCIAVAVAAQSVRSILQTLVS